MNTSQHVRFLNYNDNTGKLDFASKSTSWEARLRAKAVAVSRKRTQQTHQRKPLKISQQRHTAFYSAVVQSRS